MTKFFTFCQTSEVVWIKCCLHLPRLGSMEHFFHKCSFFLFVELRGKKEKLQFHFRCHVPADALSFGKMPNTKKKKQHFPSFLCFWKSRKTQEKETRTKTDKRKKNCIFWWGVSQHFFCFVCLYWLLPSKFSFFWKRVFFRQRSDEKKRVDWKHRLLRAKI